MIELCLRRARRKFGETFMEKTDHLWNNGPHFTFGDGAFLPSTDSFLLGGFAKAKKNERVCDLGAGMGLLGLLLWAREPSVKLTAVELSETAVALCRRNYVENGIAGQVLTADLREKKLLPHGAFDAVVCNPPYFAADSGFIAPEEQRGSARSEVTASLPDICAAASWLLPTAGRFYLCYRPERLAELVEELRRARLEPKRLKMVQKSAVNGPFLLLLECRKGGKTGLTVEAPLLLQDTDGGETDAVHYAYFRDKEA